MDLESIIGTRDEKLKFENQERTGNGDPVSYLDGPAGRLRTAARFRGGKSQGREGKTGWRLTAMFDYVGGSICHACECGRGCGECIRHP